MKEYITQAGKPDTLRLAEKIECAKLEIKWVKMTFGQGGAAQLSGPVDAANYL